MALRFLEGTFQEPDWHSYCHSSLDREIPGIILSARDEHRARPAFPDCYCDVVSPQIAVNTAVTRDELLDFISPRHHAVVITARADGTPQASPVTCGVDDGKIVVATYPERAKTRNARRQPQVSVLVLSDDFGGPWVQVDGTAEVLDVPEAIEPLVGYFRSISGEHSDWEEYRQAMVRQGKSLLRITPERWGPVATGGFPPRLA